MANSSYSAMVNSNSSSQTISDNGNFTERPVLIGSRPTAADFDNYIMFKFYSLGVVIPTGMLFNLLACAVFLRSRMHKSSTVFYFFALACADNVVLLGELLLWLNSSSSKGYITGLNFMDTSDGTCKFVHFLRYFGRLFSSWLVVAICVERFITVAYPLKSKWLSTPAKAKFVIGVLVAPCYILSCPAFFAVQERTRCLIAEQYKKAYHIWQLTVMTAGELVIPSILVIIFTCLIIRKLIHARVRRFSTREGQTKNKNKYKDRQPTIALLAVSISFITLRTLYVITYPIVQNRNTLFPNLTSWQRLHLYGLYTISFVLAVTNYSINFLLYIITGKTFRNEFVRFVLCKKSALGPSWSRTSRSHSITSQSTTLSLQRGNNGELQCTSPTIDNKNGFFEKYTPLRQNSQL